MPVCGYKSVSMQSEGLVCITYLTYHNLDDFSLPLDTLKRHLLHSKLLYLNPQNFYVQSISKYIYLPILPKKFDPVHLNLHTTSI